MSYILDALNKAERERKRGAVPTLNIADAAPVPQSPRNPWLWVAVFAVVFNAVLAGLLVYSSTRHTPEANVETVAAAPFAVVPDPPTPVPETRATTVPPPLEQTIHRAPAPAALPPVPLMNDRELQAQAREIEIDPAGIAEPATDPVMAPSDAAPVPTATTTPDADPPPLELIPLLVEKSPTYQQAMPKFRVDVHVYAQERQNRFVMINLRRFHEGDDVGDGLVIERITRDGIVFMFHGERFRFLINA